MAAPPRITITVESAVSTLQIQAVDAADAGTYLCIATNDASRTTDELRIEVNLGTITRKRRNQPGRRDEGVSWARAIKLSMYWYVHCACLSLSSFDGSHHWDCVRCGGCHSSRLLLLHCRVLRVLVCRQQHQASRWEERAVRGGGSGVSAEFANAGQSVGCPDPFWCVTCVTGMCMYVYVMGFAF